MATTNNNSTNTTEKKVSFKWGNSGPKFWSRDTSKTAITSCLRKSDDENNPRYDLVLRIQNLDENGKFVKNEDNTFDNGYFTFNQQDIARVNYQLEQMFPTNNMDNGTISGIIINHISAKTNNGSQWELVYEDEGIFMYIVYVSNGNIDKQYKHLVSNDQTLRFYDNDGNEVEETINVDILGLKSLFEAAYAVVSGLTDSVFETNGFPINGRRESQSGGHINGLKRKTRGTLGGTRRAAATSEDDDDDNDDYDNEDVSSTKKSNSKRTVNKKNNTASRAESMKALLDDDDEEDD